MLFSNHFHSWQFNPNYDGDYILIYDGNSKLISRLTGSDQGPKSISTSSNWDKKRISSPNNQMMVEFISDDVFEYSGFSAIIQFTQLKSQICESWLNTDNKNFQSPNYPNPYHTNTSCSWLITVRHGFHIEIKLHEFNVNIMYYI